MSSSNISASSNPGRKIITDQDRQAELQRQFKRVMQVEKDTKAQYANPNFSFGSLHKSGDQAKDQ